MRVGRDGMITLYQGNRGGGKAQAQREQVNRLQGEGWRMRVIDEWGDGRVLVRGKEVRAAPPSPGSSNPLITGDNPTPYAPQERRGSQRWCSTSTDNFTNSGEVEECPNKPLLTSK